MTEPDENVDVQRLKWLLLVSSVVSIFFLLLAAFDENLSSQWRQYQVDYRVSLIEQADSEQARQAAANMEIGFKQLFLPELGRVDRCVTCHVGIDNPSQTEAPQPLCAHPDKPAGLLAHHPFDKFGCTVCHDGQSRATEVDAAHGDVAHWPSPLLRGERVYTSCGRCHYEVDAYGAADDLYASGKPNRPLMRQELEARMPGADSIGRGKQLLVDSGCLGCHVYRSRGGTLGPDITYAGDKNKHGYDFKHIHGEHTVENWLFQHFKNPAAVSPGSLMPDMGLSDDQARDLTQYMLSLRRKNMPAAYTPVPMQRVDDEPATGAQLYNLYCLSCHGPDGKGSTVRMGNVPLAADAPRQLMVPSINHEDTLGTASDAYLRTIIAHGRPGTNMINWQGANGGGLRGEEVDRLVDHIRAWQTEGPAPGTVSAERGDARIGRAIYTASCAACHGAMGAGGIGPSLNTPTFLGIASDQYLARTILNGRPNTAMTGYRHFDAQQLSDLVAFMRSWHPLRHDRKQTAQLISDADSPEASVAIGRTLYQSNCVTCHGQNGQGDLGPSLNTNEFLTIVDNDFLYDAISSGRPGTGMPAWRHLSSRDVASLIKFMRTWQTAPARQLASHRAAGDAEIGKLIYERACAACHGIEAQGALGTQLRNAVFLRSASDEMLREWIAYGKSGTQMLGFLKGQQGPVELSASQIDDVIRYLRTLEAEPGTMVAMNPNGRPELGEQWYMNACASCHGERGEGASGPSLSNPAFLESVSDGFLLATLALGRDGTEMRPVKKSPQSILSLSSDQVNDIVTFIRSWQVDPPYVVGHDVPHNFVIPWDLARGRALYTSHCAGCHGVNGMAEKIDPELSAWAPQLNNEGFLRAATDGYLQATIIRGRHGTAMRPFGKGMQGVAELSGEEIDDIVAYIRQWAKDPASPMTIPAERSIEPPTEVASSGD